MTCVKVCKSCNTSKGNKMPEVFYTKEQIDRLEWILSKVQTRSLFCKDYPNREIQMTDNIVLTAEAQQAVADAQIAGFDVMAVTIGGKMYVYRPILRAEWKGLLRKRNEAMQAAGEDDLKKADIMENELEELLKICLVYAPMGIEKMPAGTVQNLADAVLAVSGFAGLDTEPIKL